MRDPFALPRIPASDNANRGGLVLPRPFQTITRVVRSPQSPSINYERITGDDSVMVDLLDTDSWDFFSVQIPDGAGCCQFRVVGDGELFASFSSAGAPPFDNFINADPSSRYSLTQQEGFSSGYFYIDKTSREIFDCVEAGQIILKGIAWQSWVNILFWRYQ